MAAPAGNSSARGRFEPRRRADGAACTLSSRGRRAAETIVALLDVCVEFDPLDRCLHRLQGREMPWLLCRVSATELHPFFTVQHRCYHLVRSLPAPRVGCRRHCVRVRSASSARPQCPMAWFITCEETYAKHARMPDTEKVQRKRSHLVCQERRICMTAGKLPRTPILHRVTRCLEETLRCRKMIAAPVHAHPLRLVSNGLMHMSWLSYSG